MKAWKELSLVEKIVVVVILLIMASSPELAFLLDAGGIDMVLMILFVYSYQIKTWLDMHLGFLKYPIIEKSSYIKSVSLSSALLFVTSSFVFSSGFFLLLMFLRKG